MTFWKGKATGTENRSWMPGVGRGWFLWSTRRFGQREVVVTDCSLSCGGAGARCVCQNSQNCMLKRMMLLLCKLHLNLKHEKKKKKRKKRKQRWSYRAKILEFPLWLNCLRNQHSLLENSGSIPGLKIQCCPDPQLQLWCSPQLQLPFNPWSRNFHML